METALYRSLIAKTGTRSSEWLPLWMHLEDTAGVMKCLLEDFVSKSFAESCGLEKGLFEKTAVFAACMHDIGKATVSFQYNSGYRYRTELGQSGNFYYGSAYGLRKNGSGSTQTGRWRAFKPNKR